MIAADAVGRHHVEQVMGMAVSIDIRDEDAPLQVVAEVVRWLHHVDETFSTYKPESPISAIGRGHMSVADASVEVREVLRRCENMRLDTNGAFDAWDVPAPNGTRFDPSGLVKGWAVERSAEMLLTHGCENFCINAGGDVALRGHRHDTEPWRVGIRHPYDDQALALVVEGSGRLGIATSAAYERGNHIVDPRVHEPARLLASATVVGPDLTVADGYATAVFVMGLDGLDWIENRVGYEAYVITHEEQTMWSSGFARYRV